MYEDYWKLNEKPFQNNFDQRFLYRSAQYDEALTRLVYAAREKRHGIVVSGEYGIGKSLILHCFLKRIRSGEERFRVVHIGDPLMRMVDFYREFLHQLGSQVIAHNSRPHLASTLRETLIAAQNSGSHTIVAVDEVDLIDADTMEEMRLLLDLCHPRTQQSLLTLVLCGRLQGTHLLGSPALRQRIPIRCRLEPLSEEQCAQYIQHRVMVAGQPNPLFTPEALRAIFQRSGGAPRSINNICNLSLFLGYSRGAILVDADIIETVTEEIPTALS